ncbi:MAG: uracil-DNA glycosylase [Rhodocyclaceae bacterium]|nr:uracil-DNA glycosylase [Rhodocyclaceae bacterium]
MKRDEARLRELGLWPPHGLRAAVPLRDPGTAAGLATAALAAAPVASAIASATVDTLDWPALDAAIRACSACGLCRTRRQAVPGTGSRTARLLVVGEAPGAEEDQRGEPFVGRAGGLLDQMLLAIGFDRTRVYIANVLKCRPPENRNPAPDEVDACAPFLQRQIALLQPAVILALGSFAARALLGGDGRVGALRGTLHAHRGVPVVVSYHPAYLLRSPQEKLRAWEDLCRLGDVLAAAGQRTDRSA